METQTERLAREQREKAQARRDLYDFAAGRNHPTAAHGQIRQRAQATADAMDIEEEERQRIQAEEAERQFKSRIRDTYISAGGSASGFEADWPDLRAEIVRRETLNAAAAVDPKRPDTGAQKYLRAHYRR